MDWLLSDEFVTFSQQIAEIHNEKKQIKQQLKELYEKSQANIKDLDAQAQALSDDFEKWKKSAAEDSPKQIKK